MKERQVTGILVFVRNSGGHYTDKSVKVVMRGGSGLGTGRLKSSMDQSMEGGLVAGC